MFMFVASFRLRCSRGCR